MRIVHDILSALGLLAVLGVFGWVVATGIASDDYAYDNVDDVLASLAFLLPLAAFTAAPVAIGSVLVRHGRSCWLGQSLALATIVAGLVAIFASEGSTAALGLLYLPFVAGAAFVAGYAVQAAARRVRRTRQ